MIDKVQMYKNNIKKSDIKLNNLTEYRRKDGSRYYEGKINDITVAYYEDTRRIRLVGRLVNMKDKNNRVYNFDDYLIAREDEEIRGNNGIDDIISISNNELNKFLGTKDLDIRNFIVSRIEICFNIWLKDDNVDDYLAIFKEIYKKSKKKGYDHFIPKDVLMNRTEDYKSFYLKTKGDDKKRKLTNRNINFYNKLNQLRYREKNDKIRLRDREIELAKNLLRLEIQLGYQYMYRHFGRKENRPFKRFLDLRLCYDMLVNEYRFFLGNERLDFYSYQAAKKKIEDTDLLEEKERKLLLDDIRNRYQFNNWRSKATQDKYNKLLERLGIHHIFIPSKIVKTKDLHYLDSPIRLLDEKLEYYLKNKIDSKYFILR